MMMNALLLYFRSPTNNPAEGNDDGLFIITMVLFFWDYGKKIDFKPTGFCCCCWWLFEEVTSAASADAMIGDK